MNEDKRLPDPELVSAAVDHELSPEEQSLVEEALASDADLQTEFDTLAGVKQLTHRAMNDEPVPDDLFARLQGAIDQDLAATTPSPTRRAARPRRRAWPLLSVAAVAAAVLLVVLYGRRPAGNAPGPLTVAQVEFDPAHLAMTHKMWQMEFAKAKPTETVDQMAATLTKKLGYQVVAPDLAALRAKLKACTTCDHSVPGSEVALFVMSRPDGDAVSLYELRAPAERVKLVGFQPTGTPGVSAAEKDGLRFVAWAQGDLHACLVSSKTPLPELIRTAPHSLRVALAQQTWRVASL